MYFVWTFNWIPPPPGRRWRYEILLALIWNIFILISFSGDQLSCIIELLGMPPQKLLDQSKRAKNFISSKGEKNYWKIFVTLVTKIFSFRSPSLLYGHHATRRNHSSQWRSKSSWQTSRSSRISGTPNSTEGMWWPSFPWLHPEMSGVGPSSTDDSKCRSPTRLASKATTKTSSGTSSSSLTTPIQSWPHLRFWDESTSKWIIACGIHLHYFVNHLGKIERGGVDFPDTSNIVWWLKAK